MLFNHIVLLHILTWHFRRILIIKSCQCLPSRSTSGLSKWTILHRGDFCSATSDWTITGIPTTDLTKFYRLWLCAPRNAMEDSLGLRNSISICWNLLQPLLRLLLLCTDGRRGNWFLHDQNWCTTRLRAFADVIPLHHRLQCPPLHRPPTHWHTLDSWQPLPCHYRNSRPETALRDLIMALENQVLDSELVDKRPKSFTSVM